MAKTSNHKAENGRGAVWGAVISVLAGLLVWAMPGCRETMGHGSLDTTQFLRPSVAATNVVIVAMDEESFVRLGQNTNVLWDRRLHARLLRRLSAAGARLAVFDVHFNTAWPEPAVDRDFAEAIHDFGEVILAAELHRTHFGDVGEMDIPEPPIRILAEEANIGYARLPDETDQVLRRHNGDPRYESLAWKAITLLREPPGAIEQPRYFNFYGGKFPIASISYYLALDANAVPSTRFEGKIVFIGDTRSRKNNDRWNTPFTTDTAETISGVELQSLAFLNLWRGDWLERFSHGEEFLCLVAAGALFGAGLVGRRPWRALVLLVLGWMILGGIVWWLSRSTNLWFGWMTVAFVQMPVAFLWAMFAHTARLTAVPGFAPASDNTEIEQEKPTVPAVLSSIPDHELLSVIGRGGYGEVWLSRNLFNAFHAVKIVHRGKFSNEEPFEREWRGVEKFMPLSRSHPGWVPILHAGKSDDGASFYYVMEAADDQTTGQSIDPACYQPRTVASDLEKHGAQAWQDCLATGLFLLDALAFLHEHRLIHRDIKPSNIVYLRGQPRFVDVGLVTDQAGPGQDSSFVGSFDYLCPEGPGSPSGDIYSLGKVLYVMMSGLPPSLFPELPTGMMETAHESGLLDFFELIGKACEPDLRRRYQSAQEFRDALVRLKPDSHL